MRRFIDEVLDYATSRYPGKSVRAESAADPSPTTTVSDGETSGADTESTSAVDRDNPGGELGMTAPIAVAGLADTVKNAIAGMNRAKQAAADLEGSAGRLVSNIASVESIRSQLDNANEQLEAAVAAVGAPLESSSASPETSAGSSPMSSASEAAPQAAPAQTTSATPAEAINHSTAEVSARNAAHQAAGQAKA